MTGAHQGPRCATCHSGQVYADLSTACYSCHQSAYKTAADPNHVQGHYPQACQQCHATTAWSPATFDHNLSAFPLTGAHSAASCVQCHPSGQYTGTPTDCYACHSADFTAATDPSHSQNQFPHTCASCHTTSAWEPSSFNHNATAFPLTGAHVSANCRECHPGGQYVNRPTDCYSCHQEDFTATANPNHVAGNYSHNCSLCHATVHWSPATFDHNLSSFPLTGTHQTVTCTQCHAGGQYSGTPNDCWSCHQANYTAAADPSHTANQFPHECNSCHNTSGWQPSTFSHAATAFPLTGAHTSASCAACHSGGNYSTLATACASCHQGDYNATTDPHHAAAGFALTCQTCHTTTTWTGGTFNHATTGFPLTGAHQTPRCTACHGSGQYSGLATDCYSCHSGDFTTAADPAHVPNQFPHDCRTCHSSGSWTPSTFNHAATAFPLTGAHLTPACVACHTNGQYSNLSTQCYTCHSVDYAGTDDPNHAAAGFPLTCQSCHSTSNWDATFDHSTTGFALTGAHGSARCNQCHGSGPYSATAADCWSCHQSNFAAATNPNHVAGNFSHQCQTCHSAVAWQPATFNHNLSAFPLTGRHTTVACADCHINGQYTGTPTECYACHATDFQSAANPSHTANSFPHTCTQCHGTTGWSPSTFNHAATSFPLSGAHATVSCANCHTGGQYTDLPGDCNSCHAADYQGAANPSHTALHLSLLCATCHTTGDWSPAQFDHNLAAFPLTGAHRTVTCTQCHPGGQYAGTPASCFACHSADYAGAVTPGHTANQFPHDCTPCHSTSAWQPSTFNHAATTFPLTGAHVPLACAQCHHNGQYSGLASQCYDCHSADYAAGDNPNHTAAGFSHACQTCHSTTNWNAAFDHTATGFALSGAHTSVSCRACHTGGAYSATPTACFDCHQTDFQGAGSPSHTANQFPHDCRECHSLGGWLPSTFNHGATAFPLTGAHIATSCIQCHSGGQYTNLAASCWSCHEADYRASDNPDHETAAFPHSCTDCHGTQAWTPATFNHDLTLFPLRGAHTGVSCQACHPGGQYSGTSTACFSCHQADFTAVTDPNHVAGNFSHLCQNCHTVTAWQPASFNHSLSAFPLTGAHTSVSCTQCHAGGHYTGTPTDCYACHTTDFQSAANPSHTANNFPHTCPQCHGTNGWSPSTFNHAATSFPLSGAHVSVACAACHVGGQYQNLATDCYSCHTGDFAGTTNPNHTAAAFPHTCLNCHTQTAWQPASFNHNTTGFALTGAHITASCASCHLNGQYAGTPNECYFCHTADFTGTTDPAHATAGFPHDCALCHTTGNWNAQFNHDAPYFPIYSGRHRNEWDHCSDCHTNAGNFTVFSCINCHEHSQSETDGHHDEVSGYSYNSQACYTCHPRGTADDDRRLPAVRSGN